MNRDIYQQMTDKIMLTGSKLIPELFRMIVNDAEARLLMAMPGTPEQLAEKPVDLLACLLLFPQQGTQLPRNSIGRHLVKQPLQAEHHSALFFLQ